MYIIYYRTGPRDGSKPYTRNRVEETLVSYPQQTMLNKFKQSWPKMAFVCVLGIVVSYVICRGREQTAFVWIINAIFSAGMALLLVGIAHQLTNMHMFTSLSYGVKLLKMIFRNEHKSADIATAANIMMTYPYICYVQQYSLRYRRCFHYYICFKANETLTNLTLNLKPIMASAKNKRTKKERKPT